jgi:sterol 3beta-glucosyltransferase
MTIGKSICAEDGVRTAIEMIYRNLNYARSLIREGGDKTTTAEEGDETLIELQKLHFSESDMVNFARKAMNAGADLSEAPESYEEVDNPQRSDRTKRKEGGEEEHSTDSSWSLVDRT